MSIFGSGSPRFLERGPKSGPQRGSQKMMVFQGSKDLNSSDSLNIIDALMQQHCVQESANEHLWIWVSKVPGEGPKIRSSKRVSKDDGFSGI